MDLRAEKKEYRIFTFYYSFSLLKKFTSKGLLIRRYLFLLSIGSMVLKNNFRIASQLCKHSLWKSHGRGITRESAWEVCKLKISHSENTKGLDRAIKRLWALFYWMFENTPIYKIFVSEHYNLMRQDRTIINQK